MNKNFYIQNRKKYLDIVIVHQKNGFVKGIIRKCNFLYKKAQNLYKIQNKLYRCNNNPE